MDVGVGVLQRTFMMMKLSLILWLLLQQTAITALQLPTTEVTRRTAVSNLIASTTAAAAASSSLISPPSALANELTASSNAITLNSQNKKAFPLASFGLQIYNDDVAYKLTLIALEVGYRNFFASVLAGNQKGFARAIKDSGIPRDELYICGTVLSNRVNGEDAAYKKTAQGCLENMQAFSAGNIDKLEDSGRHLRR